MAPLPRFSRPAPDRDILAAVATVGQVARRLYAAAVINEGWTELGITLSPVPPAGNYVGCVIVDRTAYVGGHGPIAGGARQVLRSARRGVR
jgi:hypothetical protein